MVGLILELIGSVLKYITDCSKPRNIHLPIGYLQLLLFPVHTVATISWVLMYQCTLKLGGTLATIPPKNIKTIFNLKNPCLLLSASFVPNVSLIGLKMTVSGENIYIFISFLETKFFRHSNYRFFFSRCEDDFFSIHFHFKHESETRIRDKSEGSLSIGIA